jgi:hypothetical protein
MGNCAITALGAIGADMAGVGFDKTIIFGTVNGSASYATNGDAFTTALLQAALRLLYPEATISAITGVVVGKSYGDPPTCVLYSHDATNSKLIAATPSATLTKVTETGLAAASHVFTPTGTPFAILSAAGTTGLAKALNLQRNLAPVVSQDANVATDESTFTTLAADACTAAQCTYLTYTPQAEVTATTNLSGANYAAFFVAVCSK